MNNKLVWVAVLILAGAGIYLGSKGDDKTTSGQTGKTSLNKEVQNKCQSQVGDELFCKFAGAFANIGAYQVTANVNSNEGATSIELASDAKGNSQMVLKKDGQSQTLVSYNGSTYVKGPGDSAWTKYPSGDASAQIIDLKKEFVKGDFDKNDKGEKISYKKIGTESCGNLQCWKYEVTEPSQNGFLYFDTQNYWLRRVTISNSASNTDMNLTYENVSIAEPSPVK